MIKRRINDTLLHSKTLCKLQYPLFNPRIENNSCFDFHINGKICRFYQPINLLKCWDLFLCIFQMRFVKIKFFQFFIGVIFYPAFSIADTIDRLIMDNDEFSIFCHLHVKFDSICSHLNCFPECI